jgi:hypothetical protein
MEPRGFGRHRSGTKAGLGFVLLIVGLAACGGGSRSPLCVAQDGLRDALRAMGSAENANAAGDLATVGRQMDEVDRLLRVARTRLASAAANPSTGAAAQAMLEAANYLEFMVGQFRASGTVDYSLTQFASRELNRAVSGAGGAPLNC